MRTDQIEAGKVEMLRVKPELALKRDQRGEKKENKKRKTKGR